MSSGLCSRRNRHNGSHFESPTPTILMNDSCNRRNEYVMVNTLARDNQEGYRKAPASIECRYQGVQQGDDAAAEPLLQAAQKAIDDGTGFADRYAAIVRVFAEATRVLNGMDAADSFDDDLIKEARAA